MIKVDDDKGICKLIKYKDPGGSNNIQMSHKFGNNKIIILFFFDLILENSSNSFPKEGITNVWFNVKSGFSIRFSII